MQIDINENELQDYVDQRIKQIANQKIKARLDEMDWFKQIDRIIEIAVDQRVTNDVVSRVVSELDKERLFSHIASALTDILKERFDD